MSLFLYCINYLKFWKNKCADIEVTQFYRPINATTAHGSQPEEAGITHHQNGELLTKSGAINVKISEEMFDSIIREVVEEIGVPASSLVSTFKY